MKTHRPLFWMALCLMVGIVLGKNHFVFFPWMLAGACMLWGISACCVQKKMLGTASMLMLFVVLGAAMCMQHQTWGARDVHKQIRFARTLTLTGKIVSDVTHREFSGRKKTSFHLKLQGKYSGKVLVNVFRHEDVRYGDVIEVSGKLHHPFEFDDSSQFSYPAFLAQHNIYRILSVKKSNPITILSRAEGAWITTQAFHLRDQLLQLFDQYLTPNESGVMQAIMLGERSHIPHHIRELFVQTGTAHILAISGLHIGMVAFFVLLIFRGCSLPRPWPFVLTMCVLMVYGMLTGGRPSVLRALLMSSIFLTSFVVEREMDSLNSLGLAAIMLLVMNPLMLFHVGFQLSFMSVYAIVLCFGQLPETSSKPVRSAVLVSSAAFVGVSGLTMYYFGTISPVALIVNVLVVPIMSLVVLLGLGVMAFHFLCSWVALAFAGCLSLTLNVMVKIIHIFSHIPYGHVVFTPIGLRETFAYYAMFQLVIILMWLRRQRIGRV